MHDEDPKRPPNHRFLIQSANHTNEFDMRQYVRRVFGEEVERCVVLVAGCRLPQGMGTYTWQLPWQWHERGFRAYVPTEFRWNDNKRTRLRRLATPVVNYEPVPV